ncbi:MAG: Rpn family recombination-promoting nuclease/putative transposase, partial [Planctomycetota bacterium]|nr:Rpn family recombination-promoting nuclease/putative transposase [Planctomycetota bacterium]
MTKTAAATFSHPHDLLVRSMLADADLAADLLRNYLDPDLTALLDLDRLARESPVAVDESLAETRGDLRYSLPFKGSGRQLRVFVFVEHQSTPDRFMSLRLLEYVCKAYRQH